MSNCIHGKYTMLDTSVLQLVEVIKNLQNLLENLVRFREEHRNIFSTCVPCMNDVLLCIVSSRKLIICNIVDIEVLTITIINVICFKPIV